MMVRPVSAVRVQADAYIMLVDEVLAVGDAAFGQKCMDVFYDKRRAGKTIVLVTHDMAVVQSLCDRAMLIEDGGIRHIGEPEDTAMRYLRANFAGSPAAEERATVNLNARVVHAALTDEAGAPIENLEQGSPLRVDIVVEAARELDRPQFVFHVVNADGVVVSGFTRVLDRSTAAGARIRLAGEIENRLVAGRYFLDCWVRQDAPESGMELQALRLLRFVVFGTAARHGVVDLTADVEPVLEREPRAAS